MTDPQSGYFVTLRDVAGDLKDLTTEIHRLSGQLGGIDTAVASNTQSRVDHESRIRRLEDARIEAGALAAYKRRATTAFWAAVASICTAGIALGGLLAHVRVR